MNDFRNFLRGMETLYEVRHRPGVLLFPKLPLRDGNAH